MGAGGSDDGAVDSCLVGAGIRGATGALAAGDGSEAGAVPSVVIILAVVTPSEGGGMGGGVVDGAQTFLFFRN